MIPASNESNMLWGTALGIYQGWALEWTIKKVRKNMEICRKLLTGREILIKIAISSFHCDTKEIAVY